MGKVLVLGASGATGKRLVRELLSRDIDVIAIVRSGSSIKREFLDVPRYHEITGDIIDIPDALLASYVENCDTVFSCLGHNLTLQGIFGQPRRLVVGAMEKISRAIESVGSERTTKLVLMNTTGNRNRDIPEAPPISQRIVVAMVRAILPPHRDNEQAADFLRTKIGQNHTLIEWAAVRPGGLVEETTVSKYLVQASPDRNVIFDDGKTSRINVAHFMAELALDDELWERWKGKMPVIYNAE